MARERLEAEQKLLQEKLDGPFKAYQEYLAARATWERVRAQIVGTEGQTDTVAFYKARIEELSTLPGRCRELQAKQDELVRHIHQELLSIGEEEGASKLSGLIRSTDFNDTESVVTGIRAIRSEITRSGDNDLPLLPILRAKVEAAHFYSSLFDLRNLKTKFSLSLAGTSIQQMLPGQRGALLLIFYLLVDTAPPPYPRSARGEP